jgi:GYF domain 2
MYKIIGGDQKEYGPVTADELRLWIAEGRLSAQSYVRGESSSEWKPLSSFPEFAEALLAQVRQPPLAAAIAPPANAAAWSAQILARPPEVQVGRCLSLSWKLLSANFGLLFSATFLVWLIGIICQFIPFAGILYSVIRGVLYGGLYLIFLNRIRGQPASPGDVFAGFRLAFVQLLLAGFLTALLSSLGLICCLILPGIYLFIAWTFSVPLVADKGLEFWSAMELSRKVVTRVWFEIFGLMVAAFLPFILIYLFAEIKISSAAFSAIQDAMSSGQPDFARMMRVIMEIAKSSLPLVFLIKFVLLLNLPFALGALMYAYESLFGTRTAPTP